MFVIKGKYNIAKIFLPSPENLEEETLKQIYSFLNHPAFEGEPICIMPDCHKGSGSCIGFTMPLNNYVLPQIVGVDIGCGVATYPLGINASELDRPAVDSFIKENIPLGKRANNFKNPKYQISKFMEEIGSYNSSEVMCFNDDISEISVLIKESDSFIYFVQSLGTLGAGNHYIEIGKDEADQLWLTVHSGSRNFGYKIAEYFQNRAKELMIEFFIGSAYKDLEFIPRDHKYARQYLANMEFAQEYAQFNRRIMLYRIVKGFFKQDWDINKIVESVHNYIDFSDHNKPIIRKGAIRAFTGEKLIIPFNREDGMIIGEGKSNSEWNFSAPHGAGRVLSRTKAKESLFLEDSIKSMEAAGVYSSTVNNSTIDEDKRAYKDPKLILDSIVETVEIKSFVKPIYNLKAGED